MSASIIYAESNKPGHRIQPTIMTKEKNKTLHPRKISFYLALDILS